MPNTNDTEQRREEFVDAAEKLFKKNGIVDTTVNAIVKEVDVAKGLFYYYFKSKDDVIDAISKKYNETFQKGITNSLTHTDYNEQLSQCIENITDAFRTMWANLNGETKNIDLSILASKTIDEAKASASEILNKVLNEGIDKNILDIEHPEYYADMLVSGISDLIRQGNNTVQDIKDFVMDFMDKIRKDINNG